MIVPSRVVQCVRWLTIAVTAAFGVAGAFAALVMPYRLWDSLAFGAWSRSIAETGSLWAGTNGLSVTRPLFYVPQGLVWRFVTEDESAGRVLSLGFAVILVVSVWLLAHRLAVESPQRAFLPSLAVLVLLSSAVLAAQAASGMTDVPVAAASAATAVVLWSPLDARLLLILAALGSAASILAKPSGLLALGGLALATLVLRGRSSAPGLLGIAVGICVALGYGAWHAARLNTGLVDLLRAGNDDFWLERGASVRWETFVAAGWLGEGTRLLVLYGLAYAVSRAAGARSRSALSVAAVASLLWSVGGPLAAGEGVGHPFDAGALGIAVWFALAAVLVTAALVANDGEDALQRRAYFALLLWLAPTFLVWVTQRPDELRLLAPAWAPFALIAAAALTSASLALLRRKPVLAVAPAAAAAAIALANVVSVDGLGRDGWRSLLDLGPSRWRDTAEMENFAYGPLSYHLERARENVRDGDRIVSSDGRLQYFFPGRVEVVYARTCSELDGARFFSFLSSGESLEQAELQQQPTSAIGWLQCDEPAVELVGEQEGIYAAFVVGAPIRAPTAEDCRIAAGAGQLLDGVFGKDLTYEDASALVARALAVGFEGTHIERTGCSRFRVVVTGIPEDVAVQRAFRGQVRRVGLDVAYEPAARFPEIEAGIPPVRP